MPPAHAGDPRRFVPAPAHHVRSPAMLAIREEGAGDPLVLVHGAGTSSAIWHRVMAHLASERRVVAPDLPGYGGSPAAGPGFALDT